MNSLPFKGSEDLLAGFVAKEIQRVQENDANSIIAEVIKNELQDCDATYLISIGMGPAYRSVYFELSSEDPSSDLSEKKLETLCRFLSSYEELKLAMCIIRVLKDCLNFQHAEASDPSFGLGDSLLLEKLGFEVKQFKNEDTSNIVHSLSFSSSSGVVIIARYLDDPALESLITLICKSSSKVILILNHPEKGSSSKVDLSDGERIEFSSNIKIDKREIVDADLIDCFIMYVFKLN